MMTKGSPAIASAVRTTAALTYAYTAPWGGFGSPGAIYLLGQGPCNDIPATLASGFAWPSFLNKLAAGTKVTITGVPSYADAWSKTNNCPTGGIVASGIVIGSAAVPTPAPSTVPVASRIDIDAGGAATGDWIADTSFSGGSVAGSTASVDTTHVASPAPQAVYQSYRYAPRLTYTIAKLTPSAAYTVRLHFAETFWSAAGQRVFNVSINSAWELANFDIFASAGGKNVAIVKQYNVAADANGQLAIVLAATTNNALIAGIEVIKGSSTATPAPTTAPSAAPTSTPTSPPGSTLYPTYSSMFTAPNNPFHMSYAALKALPNQSRQPSNAGSMSNNLWNQGAGGYQSVNAFPFYKGVSSDPSYIVSCTAYSSGGCGAQGKTVHLPSGWAVQSGTDHHVTIVDIPGGHEVDLWGGYNNGSYNGPHSCNVINGNTLNCSWGGDYAFNTKGLRSTNNNGSGVAGGMAEGLFELTAGDLLSSGPIQHALGMQGACLDNDTSQGTGGAIYPSSRTNGTDGSCSSFGLPSGAPPYGAMWHLKSSVNVNSLGYGQYCTKVVQAMQTYGMYLMDTGNGQDQVEVENPKSYNGPPYSSNPFYNTIWPSMASSGDGSGSGANFAFGGCLNRLNASDMEIYYAPNIGY